MQGSPFCVDGRGHITISLPYRIYDGASPESGTL